SIALENVERIMPSSESRVPF
ncbi:unnamed protein product, partial [Trypanosoma congolense IL3000]